MKLSLLTVVFLSALAAACGDDDDDVTADGSTGGPDGGPTADAAPPDAPPGPSLATLCDATDGLFPQFYDKIFGCYPEFELFIPGGAPTSAEIAMACNGAFQDYLDEGTVVLGDQAAFDACIAWLDSVTCLELEPDEPGPCDDVLVGTVALGELCDSSEQCAGDAYCDQSGGGTCGSCAMQKADGAGCDDNEECLNGRCDDDGVCRGFGAVSDPCLSDNDCAGRLICDADTSECAMEPTWMLGSACTELFQCGAFTGDLYCDTDAGECVAFRQVGETCDPGAGQLCDLFEYESCQAGECVAPQIVTDGAECGLFEGLKCMDTSLCTDHDGDPGTPTQCAALLDVGDACDPANNLCAFPADCRADMTCGYSDYTGMCPAP